MGKFIKDSWLVVLASLVFGLLVAGVHGSLKDRIAANNIIKRDNNMKRLMGDSCTFEEITEGDTTYFVAKDNGQTKGYCFMADGGGFADRIELIVAVDDKFEKCKGFAVMFSQETPGFGDKIVPTGTGTFSDEFIDSPCPIEGSKLKVVKTGDKSNRSDREIVAITGATITSDAVTRIVNKSILEMKSIILK